MSGVVKSLAGLAGTALAGGLSGGGLFSSVTQTAAAALGVSDWFAALRQASFRGATFHVEQGSAASGRRAASHEYPGRDVPYAEDLGRKQWSYTFNAYCIGTLYPLQRDALLKACTAKGAGTLIHPTVGSKQVVCTDVSVTEERASGNFCSFQMTFVEAGQLQQPTSKASTISAIEGAAGVATDATKSDFSNLWGVLPAVESTVNAAVDDVNGFLDDVSSLVVSPLQDVGNEFGKAMGDLGINADTLVYNAPMLATKIAGVTGGYGIAQQAGPVATGMTILGSLFTSRSGNGDGIAAKAADAKPPALREPEASPYTPPPVASMSIASQRQAENAAHFQRLVRQLALVEVSLAVPGLPLASAQEAAELRDTLWQVFDAAETAAGNAGLDASYEALVAMENAVLADVTQRMLELPAMVSYLLPTSPNAITLAWRLYQNANRCDELVDRTNAINPSFLPRAGRVLSS